MATEGRVRNLMDIRHLVSPDQATGVERLKINSDIEHSSPALGVLTTTIVHTPIIKWAFAARIRHIRQNDAILIRESSIEIKRYTEDYRLQSVAFKSDFEGCIQAAQIIGPPRPPSDAKSREEAINSKESSTEDPAMSSTVPPQMLALVLRTESEWSLYILFAYNGSFQEVRFVTYRHSLPPSNEITAQLGERVAVDPCSRAIAIAAYEGRVAIYHLKANRDIVSEVQIDGRIEEESFNPILGEQLLKVDGFILQMDFLHPQGNDSSQIILLLIVSIRGRLRQHLYTWNESQIRETADVGTPKTSSLGPELTNPLLLIPLKISPGFALVCEHKLGVCGDAVNDPKVFQIDELFDVEEQHFEAPDDPGNSLDFPLYTGWTRPIRHAGFTKGGRDTVYLCREDGLIRLVEFHLNGSMVTDSNTPLGHLRANVNTAFTVLDHDVDIYPGGSAADALLVGGHMSDGGLFTLKAHKNVSLQQCMPNWTPTLDLASVSRESIGFTPSKKSRIFACTGRGRRHGSICEVRRGIEAQELASFELDDLYGSIWLLPDSSSGTIHVLASAPQETNIISFAQGDLKASQGPTQQHWTSFLDSTHSTLCAARARNGIYIQITNCSIMAVLDCSATAMLRTDLEANRFKSLPRSTEDLSITNASIDGINSSILLTDWATTEHRLLHAQIVEERNGLALRRSPPVALKAEPTCAHIQHLQAITLIMLGTRAGEVLLYEALESGLYSRGCYKFKAGEEEETIYETMLALPKDSQRLSDCLIVCGLRSGSLLILKLTQRGQALELLNIFRLGDTAVYVKPSYSPSAEGDLPDGASAICEDAFYHLNLPEESSISPEFFRHIWFTDTQGVGICQPTLKWAVQLEPWNQRLLDLPDQETYFGLLPLELRKFSIRSSSSSKIIPRHMYVGGNPSRVLHLDQFNKVIVALTINRVINAASYSEQSTDNARVSFSALRILDPDDPDAGDNHGNEEAFEVPHNLPPNKEAYAAIVGKAGDRITGMSQWPITAQGKKWQLLLVSTLKALKRADDPPQGRIYMYSITPRNNEVNLEFKSKLATNDTVYSVAGYDNLSFVYCSGHFLYRQSFEISDQGLKTGQKISTDLRSTGRRVSVQGSLIYVSTIAHSLRVYETNSRGFRNIFSDSESRNLLNHLTFSSTSLVLASDLEKNLTGFWQPPETNVSGELRTVFEAKLPSKITCLREVSLSPDPIFGRKRPYPSMIASTIDGTFYRIEILEDEALRLLRFVQKLVERNKALCPDIQDEIRATTTADLLSNPRSPRQRHVNGDILARISKETNALGLESILHDLLREGEAEIDQDILQAIRELAIAALGSVGDSTKDLMRAVAEYIRMLS